MLGEDQYIAVPKKKVGELSAYSFEVKIRGKIIKGFVTSKGGQFFAYQNLCMHLPVTLDLNDSKFFTHDKQHLQCHMHGAMYEVETGYCVAGPCQGSRLRALEFKDDGAKLLVRVPAVLAEE